MGPKKKEEEIDLSTLPECKSINAIILCRGKKSRAAQIIQKLQKEGEKFIAKIKKSQVLDHAKEKNIYVDPNTLNDKQKKDAKFMESINTQLTSQVIAKAVKSLISTQSVKVRIQKKSNLDKQIEDKSGRKYDVMYSFEDLPESKDQFEDLAKHGENVKYILVIDPKISWASAPQLPEEEEEEEDEQIKEYKALLKKQQKTQEDIDHQAHVDKRIAQIKQFRSQSKQDSQFRNCTISYIQAQVDPYNEQKSINELLNQFFQNINKLNAQVVQYQQWKKDKHKESLGQPVQVQHQPVQGKTVFDLLNSLAKNLDEKKPTQKESANNQQDIFNLINSFSANTPINNENNKGSDLKGKSQQLFVGANQYIGSNVRLQEQIRSFIKFPGINRHLMPEIPSKSEKLRKLLQSHYALFLNKSMDLNEYFRRQQILNFQQYIKQFDEQRAYTFTDRIYEEHHSKDSLQRQLYKALEFHQYNTFTKYDENSDKLYLMLVYKNNPRRVNKKLWESNWKVIPNYQSWLKYFKNNQNNFNNTQFFDIDYQKIGNIEENTRSFTLKNGPDGATIINKQCTVSNSKQSLLYGIKKGLVFGVQNNKFFGQNGPVRVFHLQNKQTKSYETVIRLKKQVTIRLMSDGNVIIEKDGRSRMITPQGYTILYEKDRNVVLHPTGGVTYNSNTYINQSGFGLVDGKLYTSPTLKRKLQDGQVIKRDDNTVITNVLSNGKVKQKWIRFYEGTEYQVQKNKIRIQKAGQPFITCQNGTIRILTDQISIRIANNKGEYTNIIQFFQGSQLRINNEFIDVFEVNYHQQIRINIKTNQISSRFDNQAIKVGLSDAEYSKNGKKYDARQQQQKYGEDQTIPNDYFQPRLFIINNDNTGYELISENMYKTFLKDRQFVIDKIYQNKKPNYIECHIVAKQGKSNGKFIKNPLSINLDVFNNTNEQKSEASHQYISLKTLLKYEPLTPQNINELHKIKNDVQNWRKQIAKDENQYGHKQVGDANTKGRIEAKLLTLKKRQEKEVRVKTEVLKETAKKFHITAYEEILKQIEKDNKEKQLRSQFMKKKNSIVQQYKRVNVSLQGRRKEETEIVDQFMDHYFMTSQGKTALSEMPEWVFRPKQSKQPAQLDPQIKNELNNTNNLHKEEEQQQQRERYDTVEVNLNPKRQKQIYIKPSVFTQRQIDEERYAFEHQKKAYKYHQAKRKDFNVYGQQRKSKPDVPTLLRTQPISQINQKYLVTQAPLDKKVKISSMKNKLTSSASNMVEMRKQGPHTLLMKTIDKGNDINKLLERRTMMVQADLNDKLQRDVLINPTEANFGVLIERRTYELKIDIKNQDVISQRITIKRPKSVYVKAQLNQMGPIAMGMTRKISVIIKTSPQLLGKFSDEFDIVTKHEIYHIPINAHIISESQSKNEGFHLSRGVTEIEQNSKKKNQSFELPRIK